MITKKEIEHAKRLIGKDGNFKSQYPGGPETGGYSIGFLEELCEFVACLWPEDSDKLEKVLALEDCIQRALNGKDLDGKDVGRPMVRGGINYIPTWSTKLLK